MKYTTQLAVLAGIASSVGAVPSGRFELGFNDKTIAKIKENAIASTNRSWELGALAQALTELDWPDASVFRPTAFPPPTEAPDNVSNILDIAKKTVGDKPAGARALMVDGSVADPASLGVVVALANWTRSDLSDLRYADAAGSQLDHLLNHAIRTESGAISHRETEPQLWADFVYMVPPFIAYFGGMETGEPQTWLLQAAFDQCRLYRDGLRDEGGLWRHIALGSWQDAGHWGTGNAWAAGGMLRVLFSIKNSAVADSFEEQQKALAEWIDEILVASTKYQHDNGVLYNVIDDPNSFPDTASTALLASVAYRMATLTNETTHLTFANRALYHIKQSIDSDGWLKDVVDPYKFTVPGHHSPEGQSFVLLLHAAWTDYVAGITGQSALSDIVKLIATERTE